MHGQPSSYCCASDPGAVIIDSCNKIILHIEGNSLEDTPTIFYAQR